jgi:hypothetical protein
MSDVCRRRTKSADLGGGGVLSAGARRKRSPAGGLAVDGRRPGAYSGRQRCEQKMQVCILVLQVGSGSVLQLSWETREEAARPHRVQRGGDGAGLGILLGAGKDYRSKGDAAICFNSLW